MASKWVFLQGKSNALYIRTNVGERELNSHGV